MDQIDIMKQSEEIGIDVQALLSLYNLLIDQTETDINQLKVLISEKKCERGQRYSAPYKRSLPQS